MYSIERVEWWAKRSKSPEYQRVYNEIFQLLQRTNGTFLDVGCGTGEILKKAITSKRYDSVIGVDNSRLMLDKAERNVQIPYGEIKNKEPKKRLCLHDIVKDALPNCMADVITMTFPETGRDYEFTDAETKKGNFHTERIPIGWSIEFFSFSNPVDKVRKDLEAVIKKAAK